MVWCIYKGSHLSLGVVLLIWKIISTDRLNLNYYYLMLNSLQDPFGDIYAALIYHDEWLKYLFSLLSEFLHVCGRCVRYQEACL